ncbi:MAG: GTP 3',8-cyclase MoaA [Candidatus Cyclobacteriaceae bacterium M2_1C_046]
MPKQIIDNHGRPLTYLRLSVTDRCNLRCQYCIPNEKADFVPRKELLSYEEMLRIIKLLGSMGINKVRITGGEPFVKKDILYFFKELSSIEGIKWFLTTNGVRSAKYMSDLKSLKVGGINLSLDTLQPEKFFKITRRKEFDSVRQTFDAALLHNIPLKINMVVMKGINDDEIIDMAELAKDYPVEVRFIEEMPFNGEGKRKDYLSYKAIEEILFREIPALETKTFNNTANIYQSPHLKGSLGIIPAFSRTFCGTCDRIRITATGKLKTCLYGKDQLSLKDIISSGATDDDLRSYFLSTFSKRAQDGFEAEKENKFNHQSMSTIGG